MSPPFEKNKISALAFVSLSVLFVAGWLDLIIRLIRGWQGLPMEDHQWGILFAALYPFPWLLLFSQKANKTLMALIAYVVFFFAMKLKFP